MCPVMDKYNDVPDKGTIILRAIARAQQCRAICGGIAKSPAKCSFSQAVSETEKAVSTVKAAGASLQIVRLDAALLQKQAGP